MTIELVASGTTPLEVTMPAMLGVHAVIGVGEALITVAALAFIHAVRPDLLTLRDGAKGRTIPLPVPGAPGAQGAG
jgi:cobalt/nickel transport system permease protein